MGRNADNILFIPHDSSLLASGQSINEISKAKAKGMRIDLANINIANSENTVAIAKNSFWKDKFIFIKLINFSHESLFQ
jgi:hypothetical protein